MGECALIPYMLRVPSSTLFPQGRNVESPGEDPFVAGSYGTAYTRGLQMIEDEEKTGVVQAVVTLKHWLAYSIGKLISRASSESMAS